MYIIGCILFIEWYCKNKKINIMKDTALYKILFKNIYLPYIETPLFEKSIIFAKELVSYRNQQMGNPVVNLNTVKTLVSFWLNGKKSLPQKYKEALKLILFEKLSSELKVGEIMKEIQLVEKSILNKKRVAKERERNIEIQDLIRKIKLTKRILVTICDSEAFFKTGGSEVLLNQMLYDVLDFIRTGKIHRTYLCYFPYSRYWTVQKADLFWIRFYEMINKFKPSSKDLMNKSLIQNWNRNIDNLEEMIGTLCIDEDFLGLPIILLDPILKKEDLLDYDGVPVEIGYFYSEKIIPLRMFGKSIKYWKRGLEKALAGSNVTKYQLSQTIKRQTLLISLNKN